MIIHYQLNSKSFICVNMYEQIEACFSGIKLFVHKHIFISCHLDYIQLNVLNNSRAWFKWNKILFFQIINIYDHKIHQAYLLAYLKKHDFTKIISCLLPVICITLKKLSVILHRASKFMNIFSLYGI